MSAKKIGGSAKFCGGNVSRLVELTQPSKQNRLVILGIEGWVKFVPLLAFCKNAAGLI